MKVYKGTGKGRLSDDSERGSGRVGLYDKSFIWQGYDLWVGIARLHRLATIGEPLIARKKHRASITRRTGKSNEFWDLFRVQLKAARYLEFTGAGLASMG